MASDRMRKPLKLVVSDVDGTLTRSDKSLSPDVVAAVGRLQAAGVDFSIISARPPSGILWIARQLGLKTPIGAFNGGTIVRPDGAIVSAAHIEEATARRAIALMHRPEVDLWLFANGHWYAGADDLDNPHVPSERKTTASQEATFRTPADVAGPFDKIVGVCDNHDLLAKLDGEVAKALGDKATVGRSQLYYLDVTAPGGDKGHGVAAIAEAAGLDLDEIAVIGDQRNDLAMFARAGFSVAMGQGPEEVRAAASKVTVSNDEDGVARAIDEIFLPMVKGA